MRNMGPILSEKMDGTTLVVGKSGASLKDMHSIILDYLNSYDNSPSNIVLFIAGNDCGRKIEMKYVNANYDKLLDDIHRKCPNATIFVSLVPPTRHTYEINTRICTLNHHLDKVAALKRSYVISVRAASCDLNHYYWDKQRNRHDIHLNMFGKRLYVDKVVSCIKNFRRIPAHVN